MVAAAYLVYLTTLPGRYGYGGFVFSHCLGSDLSDEITYFLARFSDVPEAARGGPRLFGLGLVGETLLTAAATGAVPLIMLAALVLSLTGGTRRERTGRVTVRIMAGWLLVVHGYQPLLLSFDLVRDTECFEGGWFGWIGMRFTMLPSVPGLLVGFLLLMSVRRPPGLTRRLLAWRPVRRALTRLVVTGLVVGLVATDGNRGEIAALDCETFRYGDGIPVGEDAFLCGIRGGDLFTGIPDRDVIAYGRAACALYPGQEARGYALAPICPIVHRDDTAMIAAEEVTYALSDAADEVFCDLNRHRPLIRPAHVVDAVKWTDYGAIESWDPGLEEENWDVPEAPLIATDPGLLALNVHPDFDVCLTAEVYRERPPVETKGWDHVVEVGYRSLTGHMELYDPMYADNGLEVPGLRRGDYRVRAHLREPEGDFYNPQTLLLMIFPGEGDRRRTYVGGP